MDKTQSKQFQDLILRFSQETTNSGRQKIEEQLWKNYGTERVVFVLDMSGFSLLTRKYGIIHYLSMVRRMQLTSEPIIKTYGGSLLARPAGEPGAENHASALPLPLNVVTLKTQELEAFGHQLSELDARASLSREGAWHASLKSRDVTGELFWKGHAGRAQPSGR